MVVTLPTGRKVIMNKVITIELVINNMVFIQQQFVLPISKPILLGSNFLETYFTVLDIGDHTITLHCANYMLTTSLTCNPVYNHCLAKIVVLADTEI